MALKRFVRLIFDVRTSLPSPHAFTRARHNSVVITCRVGTFPWRPRRIPKGFPPAPDTNPSVFAMGIAEHMGPLRPYVDKAASILASRMSAYGMPPPSPQKVSDALVITVITLFVSVLGYVTALCLARRDKRNAVLILGASGDSDSPAVGKTALFKTLRNGALPKYGTVPSMIPNDAIFVPHGTSQSAAPMRWIDFPGHSRLQHKLRPYLAMAKCIVFVVDAQCFTAQARRDAQLLFEVLTNPVVADRATPLLIFCNKSEMPGAAKTVTVQTRLEAELERARASASSTLRSAGVATDGSGNQGVTEVEEERAQLGYENEPFSFDHVPGAVSFAVGSAATNDVEAIINFARSSFL